jgi:hypothetical protein
MYLTRPQLIVSLLAVALALTVLELVRRRKLSEEFSLLWLVSSAGIAALGLSPRVLRSVSHALAIKYESSTVFAAGIGFAVLLLLYLSVRLSRLSYEIQELARENGLLRRELEEAKSGIRGDAA